MTCPSEPIPAGWKVWRGPVPPELVQIAVDARDHIHQYAYGSMAQVVTFNGSQVGVFKSHHTWTYKNGQLVQGICIPGVSLLVPSDSTIGVGATAMATTAPDPNLAVWGTEIQQTDWRLVFWTGLAGAAIIGAFWWVLHHGAGRALNPVRRPRCSGPHRHIKACRPGRPLCRWRRGKPCNCDAAPFPHRRGWCEGQQGVPLAVTRSASYRRSLEAGEGRRKSMRVQSLLFSRDTFTPAKAKAWAKRHGYKHGKIDETDRYVRLRQADPKGFRVKRTVTFGPGIRAIVAR